MHKFVIAALLCLCGMAGAGEITVTGESAVTVSTDVACLHLAVVTEAEKAGDAIKENNAATKKVFEAIEKQGIDKKGYATSGFTVSSRYTEKGDRVTGYKVRNAFVVKVKDVSKAGEVLDALVAAGVNQVGGVQFEATGQAELVEKARVLAVKNAREKAGMIMDALDEKIDAVKEVGDTSVRRTDAGYERSSSLSAVPLVAGDREIVVTIRVVFTTK